MKKFTAYDKANERQIEMMVSKAMCAYANWQAAEEKAFAIEERVSHRSEYEATVRCIAMFVKESVPAICTAVIDGCKEEFGI